MSTNGRKSSSRSHVVSSLRPSGPVTEADGAAVPAAATVRTKSTYLRGHKCRFLVLGLAATVVLLPPNVIVVVPMRVPMAAAAYRPSMRMEPPPTWRWRGLSSSPSRPFHPPDLDLGAGSTRVSHPPRAAGGEDASGYDDGRDDDPPPLPLRPPTPGRSMLFDPDRESSDRGREANTDTDNWMHWEEEEEDEIAASLALYWEQTKGAYNAVFVRLPVVLAGALYVKNYLFEGRPLMMDLGFWGGPFEIHPLIVVTVLWVMLL